MLTRSKELCPNCIDFTEVNVEKEIIREDEIYWVEKVVEYCSCCHHELVNTVNLRFKTRMG